MTFSKNKIGIAAIIICLAFWGQKKYSRVKNENVTQLSSTSKSYIDHNSLPQDSGILISQNTHKTDNETEKKQNQTVEPKYKFDHGIIGFEEEPKEIEKTAQLFAKGTVEDVKFIKIDYEQMLSHFKETKAFQISVNGNDEFTFVPRKVIEDTNGAQIMIAELANEIGNRTKNPRNELSFVFSGPKLMFGKFNLKGDAYTIVNRGDQLVLAKVNPNLRVD